MQNSDLAKYTRYSEDSLRAVQAELLDCAKRAPNSSLKAVFRKSAFLGADILHIHAQHIGTAAAMPW